MATTEGVKLKPVDMKLEALVIPVSDVDRAKAFYEKLGFRLDIDLVKDNFRAIQFTPPNSDASIIFGKGVTSAKPGSIDQLILAVDDVDAVRSDLISHGVNDSQGRSYFSFASFQDPDGNGWLLQEITARLPGREWKSTRAQAMDVATLAQLLHETEEHHGQYEKTHGKHNWWDWYAPYLSARQNGSSPEESAAAADRYMDGAKN